MPKTLADTKPTENSSQTLTPNWTVTENPTDP